MTKEGIKITKQSLTEHVSCTSASGVKGRWQDRRQQPQQRQQQHPWSQCSWQPRKPSLKLQIAEWSELLAVATGERSTSPIRHSSASRQLEGRRTCSLTCLQPVRLSR